MPRLAHLTAAALCLVSPALAACDYGTHLNPRRSAGAAVPISTFGYTALDGPLNWHGLNGTANALCATGKHQSPINIDSSIKKIAGSAVEFVVDAYPFGAEFENLGTTVEVPVNGTLWADKKMYSLAQFHFHSSSEHRLEQEYFPMETHFVFSAPDKSTAVVSFLIELGLPDPLLTAVFASVGMIATPGSATTTGPLVFAPLEAHLKANPIFTYSGSLTTPPCTEGVTWYISSKPLQIDQATYERVKDVIKFNSRYTQNTLGETNLLEHAASLFK